ncbi:hypothetical protein NPIL_299591 [Nephila pilipes]|uniref:Uncharacterized protein n=1 Tax=Nephila pilipes TaxID=299642 RepID=A0A8X6MU65_NEPPI|nr:hypothetical protein NPIL_299591 [Nephila pilipes]
MAVSSTTAGAAASASPATRRRHGRFRYSRRVHGGLLEHSRRRICGLLGTGRQRTAVSSATSRRRHGHLHAACYLGPTAGGDTALATPWRRQALPGQAAERHGVSSATAGGDAVPRSISQAATRRPRVFMQAANA